LTPVSQQVAVAVTDVFDPDRDVVEADGVEAAPVQPDHLVDPSPPGDHEVGADAGALTQLRVGSAIGEGVEDRADGRRNGDVLDDLAGFLQPPLAAPVVSLRV